MKTTLPSLKPTQHLRAAGTPREFLQTVRFQNSELTSFEKASAMIRNLTGIDRLSKAQAAEVRGMVATHVSRRPNAIKSEFLTRKPGRILSMQDDKLHKLAVALGTSYHNRIASLATSSRAGVAFGAGGRVEYDNNAYSKSYGYGAKFQNAGARWDDARLSDGRRVLILESSRGTEKARIAFDTRRPGSIVAAGEGLLNGDLFGTMRHGVLLRFGYVRKKIVPTGVAVQFPDPRIGAEGKRYWEHGTDIATCRTENERKIVLAEAERIAYPLRAADAAKAAMADKQRRKVTRMAGLLIRFAPNLPIGYDDARAAGACDAGIFGWAKRHHVAKTATVCLADVVATNRAWAERIAFVKASALLAASA